MKLKRLVLENYKNLPSENIELQDLNIFIGPNGSGKSNLIQVLEFLRLAIDAPLDKALGALGANPINKAPDTSNRFSIAYYFGESSQDLTYRCDFHANPGYPPKIFRELLADDDSFQGILFIRDRNHLLLSTSERSEKEKLEIKDTSLALEKYPELISQSDKTDHLMPGLRLRQALAGDLMQWGIYNSNIIHTDLIKNANPKVGQVDRALAPGGENLAVVIENLIQDDIDFEELLTQRLALLFPKTRRLRVVRSGRLSLTLEWHLKGQKEPFFLDEMSDGTIRILFWIVLLCSPKPGGLLVLEEPELGLHPQWLEFLANWIKDASEQSQIILTTHSPDLLDHFTDHLSGVKRFETNGHAQSRIRPLTEEEIKPKLEEGRQLGDLYRVGDPNLGAWAW